jgi:hypothetical protein
MRGMPRKAVHIRTAKLEQAVATSRPTLVSEVGSEKATPTLLTAFSR